MLEWTLGADLPEVAVNRISQEVIRYGRATPEASGGDPVPLACLIQDAGNLVGGGSGRTEFRRLFIGYLWVEERYRHQGLGAEIITRLESAALERGCRDALIETMNDQTAAFYARLGYDSVARLDNYVGTITRHTLIKRLAD